jgi:SHS family lactate transporter-like MFS transporter
MSEPAVAAGTAQAIPPWYGQVTPAQWKALVAAYLGWVLDAFDFTILTFLLVDIQRSFTVNSALAGALGTVTLLFRVVGGVGAGTAADRWGRKGPLMFSILWYSVFAFAGGFSTSYLMLFIVRALFGVGMGGVWAAGMPLALEHWPTRLRGIASGLLQSGYSTGFMLSALIYSSVYPLVDRAIGWRVMLWIGIVPALLVFWIVVHVQESPVWLEQQRQLRIRNSPNTLSVMRLLQADLLPVTLQTSLMIGAFMFFYYSITFWYPTLVGQRTGQTLPFLVSLNLGTMLGNILWGRVSETSLGRRGAASVATLGGILAIPIFLFASTTTLLVGGAFLMGLFGAANFGVVPTYLSERFPTAARAAGAGLAYHVGAALGSATPYLVGVMQDGGMALAVAMAWCIAVAGVLVIVMLRFVPETRGAEFV